MAAWAWLRDLDERVGLRPRRGPFACAWCMNDEHHACTGVALRPRLPGGTLSTLHRLRAEADACSCRLRDHLIER